MDSQRLKQHAWDLHGFVPVLCIYIIAISLIFYETPVGVIDGPLTSVPALGTLLLLGYAIQLRYDSFTSSYYILFCLIWLLFVRILFTSNER